MTAKQLTDSILQMAIQGKLVPQDPNDEPASVLLERIREEKRRLVVEGKLKKKDLEETPIEENEIPYDLPQGWAWVRMESLCSVKGGKRIPVGETFASSPTNHIYIRVTDMKDHSLSNKSLKYISDALYERLKQYTISKDDLYLTIAGTIGDVGIVPEDFDGMNLTENAVKLCYIHTYKMFLLYAILSPFVQAQFVDKTKQMAQPKLAIERIKSTLIPLPPLAEQHRIVERIEEYLPVIKEYGEAYDEASKMDAELPDKLKKSILQEAIMGKLGTQDPSDEPASRLLEDIRAEKQKLVEEGLLKKKDLIETPVEDDEVPFNIPESWEWGRLGDFFTIGSGLSYKKEDLQITSDNKVRVLRGGNISFGDWCQKPDDIFIAKKFVADELLLKEWTFITPAVSSLEHMGKTALIRESYDDIVVGGFILMLFPVYKSRPFLEYLNFLFQSYYYRQLCQSLTNKSGQAFYNLSRTKLLNAVIPIPPVDEQIRIVKKVEELFGEIDNMTVENNININEIEVTDNE